MAAICPSSLPLCSSGQPRRGLIEADRGSYPSSRSSSRVWSLSHSGRGFSGFPTAFGRLVSSTRVPGTALPESAFAAALRGRDSSASPHALVSPFFLPGLLPGRLWDEMELLLALLVGAYRAYSSLLGDLPGSPGPPVENQGLSLRDGGLSV